MITNDDGLRQAQDQLAEVSAALAKLQLEHPTATAEWLAVFEEGFRDHADELRREIEAYRSTVGAAESAGVDAS